MLEFQPFFTFVVGGTLFGQACMCFLFYLYVGAENMALHFIHRVHPIGHSSQMEPPEHHFILRESPWRGTKS